ncbi:pentatricopeptide repeat-containing protein At2g17210 isoform X2 [Triticum aestivum]|uniref:pentatricopeptide repeat-containing protein At2g17210 isoform X2 n=1 Tax=Triticum aestivum TaxID=4565 RepID=UPI001D0038B3|nr:pentatricopeptide repeat-containing protein At2g17210-like isoform X2 [Triticum aestivum]
MGLRSDGAQQTLCAVLLRPSLLYHYTSLSLSLSLSAGMATAAAAAVRRSLGAAGPDLSVAHLCCPSTPTTYNAAHLPPTPATLLALLRRAPASHPHAAAHVHACLLKTAYFRPGGCTVPNSLLASYATSGDSLAAAKLFDEMPLRDVASWTSMMRAHLAGGSASQALCMFRDMLTAGGSVPEPDGVVLVVALRACAELEDLALGASLHAVTERRGLRGADVFIDNSLVDMYARCLDLWSARKVFDTIPCRNVVSWNTMLSGLARAGRAADALDLLASLSLLKEGDIGFDETTLVVLLQLCKRLEGGQAMWCRSVHAVAIRRGLLLSSTGLPLLNALLDAYAKCGLLEHTLRLFRGMPERNIVTWSTVIAGCTHNGRPGDAIACAVAMREAGEIPNSVTILSVLEACADCAEMAASRCAHGMALRSGLALERDVSNALVDMYGKCGNLAAAMRVFNAMPRRDVLTWNSMISALGMNGRTRDALALVDRMEQEGDITPNGVTMLAVLSACAHGGLVEEGVACFERMTATHSVEPQVEHLSCIVDMLARAGDLEGAARVIEERISTTSSPAAWSALLSACRGHSSDSKVGRNAACRVLELEPGNAAGYLMSMGVPSAGETAARLRQLMRERGVGVTGGHSMVQVGRDAHSFMSWDGCHPDRAQVRHRLHEILWNGFKLYHRAH